MPQAKIIVLLRDPVERAYSHWKRERRDGMDPCETFEEAVAAEPARLAGEVDRILSDDSYYSYAHENFSYISQGLYLEPLRKWLEHYPREHVHVTTTERLLADPQGVYNEILEFLGLPPFRLRSTKLLNTNGTNDRLNPSTRRDLYARVGPHNRRLAGYLDVELGWDDDGVARERQAGRPSAAASTVSA